MTCDPSLQLQVRQECPDAAEETEDYDFIDLDGIQSRRGSRKGSRDDGLANFGRSEAVMINNEQETDKEK